MIKEILEKSWKFLVLTLAILSQAKTENEPNQFSLKRHEEHYQLCFFGPNPKAESEFRMLDLYQGKFNLALYDAVNTFGCDNINPKGSITQENIGKYPTCFRKGVEQGEFITVLHGNEAGTGVGKSEVVPFIEEVVPSTCMKS